jgi:hypothetical protein
LQKHPLTSYEVPETKMYKGIEREEVFGKHLRTPPFFSRTPPLNDYSS